VELKLERGDLRTKHEELVFNVAIPLAAMLVLFLRRDRRSALGARDVLGLRVPGKHDSR
jgi:hypothetical protein